MRNNWWLEIKEFGGQVGWYAKRRLWQTFWKMEGVKGVVVEGLYRRRGKYVRPFLHVVMIVLMFFGVAFGPKVIAQGFPGKRQDVWSGQTRGGEEEISLYDVQQVGTVESEKPRAEVIEYQVREGDTLFELANKFGVSQDSIKWLNKGINWGRLKPGQKIKIPPVTGVVYKVKPGDTIYSIAKKLKASPQAIVDFPFNTFANDETFALVVGQTLIVPDGVLPDTPVMQNRFVSVTTPDAGTVSATGQFIWPAKGLVTQRYHWYHRAVDIANPRGGSILAADSGRVVAAGWTNVGYGYRVIVDHGNGYRTLYAHLSKIMVRVGQSVARGNVLGMMGSTGRSTGTHLHFEIMRGNVKLNPLQVLR